MLTKFTAINVRWFHFRAGRLKLSCLVIGVEKLTAYEWNGQSIFHVLGQVIVKIYRNFQNCSFNASRFILISFFIDTVKNGKLVILLV